MNLNNPLGKVSSKSSSLLGKGSSESKPTIIQMKKSGQKGVNESKKYDIKGFVVAILKKVVTAIVLFIIGGVVIYSSRVAQANILPVCRDKQPFTSIKTKIKETIVDFNSIEVTNDEGEINLAKSKSTKIVFPLDENMTMMNKNRFFHYLKLMTNPNNSISNPVFNFLGTIMTMAVQYHFILTTKMYNYVNITLPDWAKVIFSPFIYLFILVVVPVYNMWNLIQQWFFNLPLLYGKKVSKMMSSDPSKSKKWDSSPFLFFTLDAILPFWISILALFSGILPIICMALSLIIGILFSIIPYSVFIKGEYANDRSKKYGIFKTIIDLFKNKFWIFIYFISLYLIVDANKFFGTMGGVISFVVCLFLFMFTTLYDTNKVSPSSMLTSGVAGVEQQKRTCSSFMDLFSFVYELYDVLTCAPGDTPQDTASTNVKAPLPPPPAKTDVSTTPITPTMATTTPASANVTSTKTPLPPPPAKTVVSTTPVAPTTATTPAIANVTSAKAPVTKAIAKK